MRWFSADYHFYHYNVMRYCNRPFTDLDEMHEELIRRHNNLVNKRDQTWILGDIGFAGLQKMKAVLSRMNGTKYLIEGNHDMQNNKNMRRYLEMGFHAVYQFKKINIGKIPVMLSHFPYWPNWWERKFWKTNQIRYSEYRLHDAGLWMLCGHVHDTWKFRKKMINVGVDNWNYSPVSEHEILKRIINEQLTGCVHYPLLYNL